MNQPRANGVAFRRAVWASVALHAVAVCALIWFLRTGEQKPTAHGIDTRAGDVQVRMSLPEETLDIAPPQPVAPKTVVAEPPPQPPQLEPPSTTVALPNGPVALAVPQTLPPELVALIRKPISQPTEALSTPNPPVSDPNVKPAGGASTPAIHGALQPNQTVVYVLDCSGSMGAAGKFDAARASLVSTLKQQPTSVRFQVIVYAGTAAPLLAGNGSALPATEANVRAAADALAKLDARGRSNHAEAIRAALAFRPDVILMLTDADDLNAAALKSIVATTSKAVPVCVGQVTAAGVQSPRELK